VSGKRCLAKAKTTTARRTLDPLYQQQLVFHEKYQGCVLQVTHRHPNYPDGQLLPLLQVTIWGDYGRMEGKKVFMGVAQIMLDDLDLSNIVIGWYKLFGTSSLVSVPPGGAGGSPAASGSETGGGGGGNVMLAPHNGRGGGGGGGGGSVDSFG